MNFGSLYHIASKDCNINFRKISGSSEYCKHTYRCISRGVTLPLRNWNVLTRYMKYVPKKEIRSHEYVHQYRHESFYARRDYLSADSPPYQQPSSSRCQRDRTDHLSSNISKPERNCHLWSGQALFNNGFPTIQANLRSCMFIAIATSGELIKYSILKFIRYFAIRTGA